MPGPSVEWRAITGATRRDPAQLTLDEVSAYLLHMVKERHLPLSTVSQATIACRFLQKRVPQTQPHLLAREEIALGLLAGLPNLYTSTRAGQMRHIDAAR